MTKPDWWYDDLKQVGLDFEDEAQVATYDARQGRSSEADRALLLELGMQAGTAMADIGCGTGILACEAARLGANVRAIDVSAAMLKAAQARAEGLTNIAFERAGFLSFEVRGDLDLVTTKNALHHLPDLWKAVALTRMRQALKLGGRLYIRDVAFNCTPDAIGETAEAWISFLARETGYTREDGACHVREEHSTFGWILERMITETGFTLLSRTHDGVYSTFLAEKRP